MVATRSCTLPFASATRRWCIACRRLGQPSFQGFALSLTVSDEAKAHRFFGALSDGGQVHMPLAQTIFLTRFGIVADRFGVSCMVLVEP